MEDKERELLYGLITQLSQANMQLTMTMMNMFGQMMMSKLGVNAGAFTLPQTGPNIGLGLGLPVPGATSFPEFWKDKEFVNKIMKQFFPGLDDNDKEDLK